MKKLTGVKRIRTALVWVILALILGGLLVAPSSVVADDPQPTAADVGLAPDENLTPAVDSPQSWLPETTAVSTELGIEWKLAQVSAFVEDVRDLKFIREVPIRKIPRQQFIREELSQMTGGAEFDNVVLDALHLLPEGVSAEEAISIFLGPSVLAYYDFSDGTLSYIDDGADEFEMRTILAHELDHALVHQHFPDAYKALSASSSDAYTAALSVFEGDATLIEGSYHYNYRDEYSDTVKSLSSPFLPNVAFSVRLPVLAATELDGLELWYLFPYFEGQNFVYNLYKKKASSKDPWSEVNKIYSSPPQTTEQIIHPTMYPKKGAIAVTVSTTPTSGGWRVLDRDTLGEAGLFTMFYGQGVAKLGKSYTYNSPLSAGWGGDELVGYENAAGQLGYVWVIEMDTPGDATALLTGYQKMLKLMKAKPGDGLWQLGDEFLKISIVGKKQVMIASATSAEFVAQLWPGPSLSLLSPNGGEDWQVGTTQAITWTSTGIDAKAKVKIELSLNGGKTWKAIIPSTPNDGSQDWKVAGSASTDAKIRVVSVTSKDILDASDAGFNISKP